MGVNETEIDKILNEVEELRKELTAETTDDVMAEFREQPVVGKPSVESELLEATLVNAADAANDMEATLASLKPDASAIQALFDEPSEPTLDSKPVTTAAAPVATPTPTVTPTKPELKVVENVSAGAHTVTAAPVVTATPIQVSPTSNVTSLPTPASASTSAVPGEMTMSLTGAMTLKLKYEFEGQEVTIAFADGTLKVSLADGSEFKIPLAQRKTGYQRKAS